ncbi:GTPase-activating protein [Rhizopus stolonifer]|uniref:GTPase-activating protein n=1 Tax=Rhizopus stolonifer TaxID=4846 RepID=A0A367KJA9_RHIST|nr:GTPase-activating protein [Rhizopus stolonifer]
MDHFGFRIHVRTDDEASSDDESDFDQVKKKLPSTTSDDDSIETHITTPNLSDEKYQAHRPLNTSVPILKNPPPRQRSATQTSEDIRTSKETHRSSTSQNSRYSILSSFNNPFKVPPRPASIVSVQSVVKPSETYQQRQSKRYSESLPSLIGIPRSPASNHRHFDKLVSKFRRFSHHDHQYDSEKHLMLKEEAMEELKIYKEKVDFWSMVIDDFGKLIETQMDDMRQHLAKGGMPSPIRGLLWQIIAKSRDSRQALFNVAKAYSIFDQEVGYCQGLAFIIGCLLLHMSEENAFCVLIKLMGKYGLRGHFTPRMEVLHQQLYQFDHVCQQKLPVIHRHMENEGVTPSMYASQWFITLFAYRCPIEMVFRVIDLLLVEGTQVLIQIGLALLVRNQEKILKLHFETLIDFLCNGVFSVFGDDGDRFVQDTYRVDLPVRFMARLAQQFTGEEARESKSVSQEDNLRRMNGQLSEHLRSVEAQLQLIRTENQELTQRIITTKMDHARTEDEKDQLKHDMARMKANFEKALADLKTENERLAANNIGLADQLADTESQLISLKMSMAEREGEFESLRQELKAKK